MASAYPSASDLANGGPSARSGPRIPAQGNALGWPRPRVLKERRMATRGGRRPLIHRLRRSFRAHWYAAYSTQGVALGWYAKPRWGSQQEPQRGTPRQAGQRPG